MEPTTMVFRQVSASRRATLGYVALMLSVTMIEVFESSIWRAISRSAYSGLKLTTVPPALSTAKKQIT